MIKFVCKSTFRFLSQSYSEQHRGFKINRSHCAVFEIRHDAHLSEPQLEGYPSRYPDDTVNSVYLVIVMKINTPYCSYNIYRNLEDTSGDVSK